ncbi:FAD-binding oxidoreductase [Sphingomonas sp.]|uniref:FAD-binding oxidoreductase n=1 Tax=Sphingomonas sp. TaxID=28214 RepID=UPI003B00650C
MNRAKPVGLPVLPRYGAAVAYPAPSAALLDRLRDRLGPRGFTTDAADLAPWLTDWRRRLTGSAAALVSPADADEAAFVVREAAAEGVAVVPQGGNSSMVAGATPAGLGGDRRALLVSLRRMDRVRSVSTEDDAMVAEAGVVLADLHAAAERAGRRFPLSLAAKGNATIGGLVSTNAGGTQVLRFGPMRSLVLGLEAVLPDGSRLNGLAPLRKDNRGYALDQLLIGGEGTLGLVTAATLRLVPAIGARAVAWVGLARAQDALELLRMLEASLGDAVESFELVPDEGLALVLRHVPDTRTPLGGAHPWHVLIEAVTPGDAPIGERLGEALVLAIDRGLAGDATVARSEAQADALWKLRESLSEAEARDGLAAKHDVAVPVSRMPAFMAEAAAAVTRRFPGARPIAFGHLGDGNVHFNVRAPVGGDDRAWFAAQGAAVSAFVHRFVTDAGGTLSAEHGIGRLKRADFMDLADPARLAAMRAIKRALDPKGIMNPGALLPLANGPPAP